MNSVLGGAALAALSAGSAMAGGIERSTQSVAILFEEGRYAELSFGSVDPSVSGVQSGGGPFPAGVASGDAIESFTTWSLGYKQDLSDNLDLALIVDQPIGADVSYPINPAYVFGGGNADVDSVAVTGLLRYKFPSNFSVYGGLRVQQSEGNVGIPVFGSYTMTADAETDLGYVIGAAYEIPKIAARVSLTYNSAIEHEFTGGVTENFLTPGGPATVVGDMDVTIPQSVNLDFQTGISRDTLLFGSIRWVEWTEFAITPAAFSTSILPGTSIVDYDDDVITYTLGLGRRFNDKWSGAVILGYEKSNGGFSANLGPTDGFKSISLAATYQATDKFKISGGIRYVDIGDATTNLRTGGTGDFTGNDAVGLGVKFSYTY